MKVDFEQFLSEKHFEENPQILDDDLSDAFEHWLTNLDTQELIDYGQKYAEQTIKLTIKGLEEWAEQHVVADFDVDYLLEYLKLLK